MDLVALDVECWDDHHIGVMVLDVLGVQVVVDYLVAVWACKQEEVLMVLVAVYMKAFLLVKCFGRLELSALEAGLVIRFDHKMVSLEDHKRPILKVFFLFHQKKES